MPCVFCRIVAAEIPAEFLYQDETVIAIRDISPQAPKHILVMPKEHILSIAEITEDHLPLLGNIVRVANRLAKKEGIAGTGYRLIANSGPDSGQAVSHLHFHLLGGRPLGSGLVSP